MNRLEVKLYHRRNVEKVLYQSLYADWSRLFRFAGMEQKKFLKVYWKRYEVDLINYCLRIVFNHYEKPFDLEYKKDFFDRYSQISIDKMITSRNIDELVDNLQGTEYLTMILHWISIILRHFGENSADCLRRKSWRSIRETAEQRLTF